MVHNQRDVPDPDERVVEFRIYRLQILQDQFLVEHALVEGQREASVDELPMEECLQTEIMSG